MPVIMVEDSKESYEGVLKDFRGCRSPEYEVNNENLKKEKSVNEKVDDCCIDDACSCSVCSG